MGPEDRTTSERDAAAMEQAAWADGIERLLAGTVVHDGDRILILRRTQTDSFLPGIEELPSGHADEGENLLAALAREMAEEIGWEGPIALDPGFAAPFDYASRSGRRNRQITFSVALGGRRVRLSDEHTAFRWLTPQEAEAADITDETAGVVRAWAEWRGGRQP